MYKGDRTRWLSEKRQCEYWANKNKVVYLFVRFIYEHYKVKYNTNIPARCKIGGGQNSASWRYCV